MAFRFIILLLLTGNICFAQSNIQYANFIQTNTAVKWAAVYNSYVNLTPVNPNFNIRNFYVGKLKQQGATSYVQDNASFSVTPVRLNYNQYKAGIRAVNYDVTKMNWFFNYDEKNNASEKIFIQELGTCDTCTLSNRISFFKVKQLLYYRNNQLKNSKHFYFPQLFTKKKQGLLKKQHLILKPAILRLTKLKMQMPPYLLQQNLSAGLVITWFYFHQILTAYLKQISLH